MEPPEEPELEDAWNILSVPAAGGGGFLIVAAPLLMLGALMGEAGSMSAEVGIIFGIACFGIGFGLWRLLVTPAIRTSKLNQEISDQYWKDVEQYKNYKKIIAQEDEEARKKIPALERKIKFYTSEQKKISAILKDVYNANVLPLQYRDVYAAVYLYDYFSNSRSDDLDQVLNTYVLEQLKDRLDQIIENQRVSILNQRLILVNQQKALEEQRKHNAFMRSKARQFSRSVEEQNQYLRMVECNTAATAYFAAANYLK